MKFVYYPERFQKNTGFLKEEQDCIKEFYDKKLYTIKDVKKWYKILKNYLAKETTKDCFGLIIDWQPELKNNFERLNFTEFLNYYLLDVNFYKRKKYKHPFGVAIYAD